MCASTVGRATYTDELPVSVGGEGGHCGGAGLAKPPTQGLQCRAPPSAASGPSSGGEIARGPLTPWQSMVLGRRVGPTARWLAVLVRTLLGLLAGPTKPRSCPTSTPTSRALSKATFRTSGSGTTAANDAPSAALGCQHVSGPTPLASHRSVLPLERPQPLGPPPRPKACPHLTKSKAAGCGLCVTSRQRLAFFGSSTHPGSRSHCALQRLEGLDRAADAASVCARGTSSGWPPPPPSCSRVHPRSFAAVDGRRKTQSLGGQPPAIPSRPEAFEGGPAA
jgi:hypothetical protein